MTGKNADGDAEFKFPAPNMVIDTWEWNGLMTALDHFETVFAEEMRETATSYVPAARHIFYASAGGYG